MQTKWEWCCEGSSLRVISVGIQTKNFCIQVKPASVSTTSNRSNAASILRPLVVKLLFKHVFLLSMLGHVRLTPTKGQKLSSLALLRSWPRTRSSVELFTAWKLERARSSAPSSPRYICVAARTELVDCCCCRGENHPKADQGQREGNLTPGVAPRNG